MSIEALAPYLAGPGAGLLVCILVGAGIWKLLRDAVMPLISTTVDRHLQQIDTMSKQHQAEHMRILETCERIDRKVGGVLGRMRDEQ